MATSSKVKFDLNQLLGRAIETIDLRIQQAEDKVASHGDEQAFAVRMSEWRKRQEEKIRHLVSQMDNGEVDDYRLSSFALDDAPRRFDKYDKRRDQDRLDHLCTRREQIRAKAGSLVPEDDGSISLTKTQLREFFDL